MNRRVLLVDDDADARGALRRFLTGLGHEVEEAEDAEAALGRVAPIRRWSSRIT